MRSLALDEQKKKEDPASLLGLKPGWLDLFGGVVYVCSWRLQWSSASSSLNKEWPVNYWFVEYRLSTALYSILDSRTSSSFHPYLSFPFLSLSLFLFHLGSTSFNHSLTYLWFNYLLYCFLTALRCTLFFIPNAANDGPPAVSQRIWALFFTVSTNELVKLRVKEFQDSWHNVIDFGMIFL